MSWTAILLAGSRPGRDALAERFGTDLKALIPVAGEPMVRRPAEALLSSRKVGKLIVLSQAPDRIAPVLQDDTRIELRQSQGTIAETMLELIADRGIDWPLLVTTADHALLDSGTVDHFLAASTGTDIAIGAVERATILERFPNARRSWVKLRGGAYTGANLFALRSPDVARAILLWRSVEQDRKKAWRLISILGTMPMILAALRLITLDDVLAQLGARLGLSVKAVVLDDPLAGIDVDKAEDHALTEAILAGQA